MREGWEIKQFEECLEKVTYTNKIQRKDFCQTGKYPIVSQEQEFINGYWEHEADLFKLKKPVVVFGDHTQVIKYLDFNFVLGADGVKILQTNDDIEPRYLFYYLQNVKLGSLGYARHFRLLKELKIGYPNSKSKQKEIVSILDGAFAVIDQAKENVQRNLQNAKELFQAELNTIFCNKGKGWEEKKLEQVCEISSKLIDPKNSEFQKLLHVGGGNIVSKKEQLINLQTAKEEGLISGKFLFNDTMVLYSKIRPYLEKVVRCEFTGLCSADIYPLSPFNKIVTQDFLYFLLTTKDFTDYAIKGSQRAGMPKVNREHLFEYQFYLPPIAKQKEITESLDILSIETKMLEEKYQQKLDYLEELKKSILQKAFSGELTETIKELC